MSPEKNLYLFCFWHPPSFDFHIVIIAPGINETFLPDRLKKSNPAYQPQTKSTDSHSQKKGAQWLSGRVLDSRPRGHGFEPHRRHCVVAHEQDTYILA